MKGGESAIGTGTNLHPGIAANIVLVLLLLSSGIAAAFPGLSNNEARKLDQRLAVAAESFAARSTHSNIGLSIGQALGPMAIAAGVELKDGVPVAPLLIQVRNGDIRGLEAMGITVDAVVGEVATARDVPLGRLADCARRPEVLSIQAAERLFPMNDVSVPETGASDVWNDFGFTGTGVIIGVVDTGIDVNHPDFENLNGTTRIQLLLDLSQPGNGPFGGTLFTNTQIDAGITAPDIVGHGTHVAGTAAGNGTATSTFSGVAFQADLIIVNADRTGTGSFLETDIVNAAAFIDSVATARTQPYVINLSLGGHGGAHDGTGLQELALDFLAGPGNPGKAIVAAAGNERSGPPRHAEADVPAGGLEFTVSIPSYTALPGPFNDVVQINLWSDAFSAFTITVRSPDGIVVGPFGLGQHNAPEGTDTDDGLVGVLNAVNGTNPQNGDYETNVVLIDASTTLASGTWRIQISGATGPLNGYIGFSTMGARFLPPHVAGVGFMGEPGTARNIITVGAYTTKIEWDDTDSFHHNLPGFTVGGLALFSNAGPTRDGRVKPEICAPGALIGSCYSADAPPGSKASVYTSPDPQYPNFFILQGDRYAIQLGTSQATPHVAGAVALLFDQHPDWDALDVKRALAATARVDFYTGIVPNPLFGNGKLDILAAVTATAAGDSLPPGDVNADATTDLADALLVIDFVIHRSVPSAGERERADMNADRVLDVGDAVLVLRSIAGGRPVAPMPIETDGSTWILPVSFAAEPPVFGAEIELEVEGTDFMPLWEAVRTTRDGALAVGVPGKGGPRTVRILTLALDERGLAGKEPSLLVPFRATDEAPGRDAPAWRLLSVRLLGAGAEPIQGTAILGAAERALAPSLHLLSIASNPSPTPGPVVFDVPGPAAQPVTVAIFDVAGRLVARLAAGVLNPGRHVIPWNGQTASGRPAAGGIYWVRVTAGAESVSAPLTLVR